MRIFKKSIGFLLLISILLLAMAGCGGNQLKDSGDPEYEARTIVVEGLSKSGDSDLTIEEITISELRKLPQYKLDASYKRTTGMLEEFQMEGPYLSELISHLGGDLGDYAGIGVIGKDGYYCLLSKEVIAATPDLMLALVIDGEAKLDDDKAPAHLAVQGQFGPYWVKMVEKIILYDEIPEKEIKSVWAFSSLTEGIEPFMYEYYGSHDASIEIGQIFSRLDNVDSKAFFTMKSADGFKKNEAINIVKSRYYIKTEGEDSPTNISPYIKLGMNVHNIAWISTNQDAMIFPGKMTEYMDLVTINNSRGIPLSEVLYEVEVEKLKGLTFDILGTKGEKITVDGEDLAKGILVAKDIGSASVVWEKTTAYPDIENLLRIRVAGTEGKAENAGEDEDGGEEDDVNKTEQASKSVGQPNSDFILGSDKAGADTILSISGDGVESARYFSLADLKSLASQSSKKVGYVEQVFSIVNNWPTKKFQAAKGADLEMLLSAAGLRQNAASFRIEAADGYYANLTRSQLLGKRYYYPGLLKDSLQGAAVVKPMVAWACETGTSDISKAKDCELRLIIGQLGLSDVNTAPSVQNMTKIVVSSKGGGKWPAPSILKDGDNLVFSHDNMDQVKLHYTFDGKTPDYNSPVYNPSTSYFQPDLIKPIPVSGSGKVKVKAIGYGKEDSEVVEFGY